MTQPSGWYDDPQDPSKLRYWDGVIWTDHVTPKYAPRLEEAQVSTPPQYTPAPQQTAQGGYPAYTGAPAPMPSWQQGYAVAQATTPDGVPLSGWWKRVLARFLDYLLIFIVALPLTGYFYYRYLQALSDWVNQMQADQAAGRATVAFTLPAQIYIWLVPIALLTLAVGVVYEYLFLTRSGATLGKKAVGISVRLRETPGSPPSAAVWRRILVLNGLQLLSYIPLLGNFAGIALLLDYLWPLWDPNKQAWHDKFAATNVVVGPQPKR